VVLRAQGHSNQYQRAPRLPPAGQTHLCSS
jgi:hypothetical protein